MTDTTQQTPSNPIMDAYADEVLRINTLNGWGVTEDHTDPFVVGHDFALMASEIHEAHDAYRVIEATPEGVIDPNQVWIVYEPRKSITDKTMLYRIQQICWQLNHGVMPFLEAPLEYQPFILPKPCGVPVELADAIIRIVHFCKKHNINLDEGVRVMLAFNEMRGYKHGKER